MNFGGMKAELYRILGYGTTPASEIATRMGSFINESYRRILAIPGMENIRDDHATVASIAAQEYLALPSTVLRIKSIVDRTNGIVLEELDLRSIRQANPQNNQGTPGQFGLIGYRGVTLQPSDTSTLLVDSTSASDTNTAYIDGVDSTGERVVASVTMTGTTAVAFSGTWSRIDKFYVDTAAVGVITLVEDAEGGTELARIGVGRTYVRKLHILFNPVPDTALTYDVDFIRFINGMSNDNDEPEFPQDLHWVLVAGAKAKEYERRQDFQRQQMAMAEWAQGISDLKYWVMTSGAKSLGPSPPEFSQLGSNYPAGS